MTKVLSIEDRLDHGEAIHMRFTPEGREWWIENPYEEIPLERIKALGNRLIEVGDSLFGWPGYSQTWFAARD